MPAAKDLTGQKFHRLTAIRCLGSKAGNRVWECRCECGTIKAFPANRLVFGNSASCGCLPKDVNAARLKRVGYYRKKVAAANRARTQHGHSKRGKKTRTYKIWCQLDYRRYKKATSVCALWRASYESFLRDMGPVPSAKHTIDRIDNAKGYEPGNCRWATMKQQQNNRTNNRRLTFKGKTKTMMQWSEETGLGYRTIGKRLDVLGWSVAEALTRRPDYRPR